ncbi:MAG: VOC family protein [Gammaproteobacteria bacterium]|nr:VOC family protein [Gammaproteobacteria bacterium]
MTAIVSRLLKINVRARSRENIRALLCDVLGALPMHDRGADTIGEFEGSVVELGGVMFDIVVPTDADSALAKVIDKHGEGIDSICFAVDDMDYTRDQLNERGVEFARFTEFHGSKVAFVHPRDACGIGLEFIQGPTSDAD